MFGRWLGRATAVSEPTGAEQLESSLRAELTDADEETIVVVTAIVGLLGVVAYADGEFSLAEQEHVRREVSRIEGMTLGGVDMVCAALKRHIREISAVQTPRYCRILRELGDRELRVQVLEMLMALAATDELLTTTETVAIRQITTALGLTQGDYNSAQAQFRAHLVALKPT